MAEKLKVISCNVKGLSDTSKRRQLFRYFHEGQFDVIFIQEAHCTKHKEKVWRNEFGSRIIFDHAETNARGVATLFKKSFNPKILSITCSGVGKFLKIETELEGKKLTLCNIYGPNTDAVTFFEDILQPLTNSKDEIILVGGDLNVQLTELDKKGSPWLETNTAKYVSNFLENQDWVDVWRAFNPEKQQFLCMQKKPLTMTRLDYFLLPFHCLNLITNCEIVPGLLSDHLIY